MKKETLKIIIVGHVDHGKSTLIGRLLLDTGSLPKEKLHEIKRISKELGKETELAFLTDQLEEEREKSITIDTTQIFFSTRKRNYVIIDAPGHVEFLKNMITGATQAEAAVLIVDAKEGVMEQTKRHAYIINMLGIKNVIVIFNKLDLIAYNQDRFEKVKAELVSFLGTVGIQPLYLIPISAKEGVNIAKKSLEVRWHKGPTLLEGLDSLKLKASITEKPLRFPVQDTYDLGGEKVIVGKVISGSIREGQSVKVFPSLKEAKIKAIKIFGQVHPKEALAEENIGLVLSEPLEVKRGEVISEKENPPEASHSFKGDIFWMSEEPLELGKKLTLKCATQEIECEAERIIERVNSSTLEIIEENAQFLKVNETGEVIFKSGTPIVTENFTFIEELGRFVIEKNWNVQGAGIITSSRLT